MRSLALAGVEAATVALGRAATKTDEPTESGVTPVGARVPRRSSPFRCRASSPLRPETRRSGGAANDHGLTVAAESHFEFITHFDLAAWLDRYAIDVNAAALDGFCRQGARLCKARSPQPLIDAHRAPAQTRCTCVMAPRDLPLERRLCCVRIMGVKVP